MKRITFVFLVMAAMGLFFDCAQEGYTQEGSVISTSFSLRDTPKYKEGFTHFDYVNPEAPKGGSITLSATGTFDSFNRYAQRGDEAEGSEDLYDTLMKGSEDEIDVLYPLIAEKIEYAKDFTWIIFYINPRAMFQDKKPITAADVVFTFHTFREKGSPV